MATRPITEYRTAPVLGVGYRAAATAASLAAIWVAATIAAVYSPDLVTGSNQEHLQLAMFLAWPLAAVATGMVLLAAGVTRRDAEAAGPWAVYAVLNALAWGGAALAGVFVAPMVTGTDPTTIPLAAVLGPIFAVLVTAYGSIYVAGAGREA
ncbi:MAG TPA: hypothetical protein VFB69_06685 [Candidatus Dormibacteraeota bacterium]|nr:hypothetical protein [Candidatus Dormibacteraeota bacterium]